MLAFKILDPSILKIESIKFIFYFKINKITGAASRIQYTRKCLLKIWYQSLLLFKYKAIAYLINSFGYYLLTNPVNKINRNQNAPSTAAVYLFESNSL